MHPAALTSASSAPSAFGQQRHGIVATPSAVQAAAKAAGQAAASVAPISSAVLFVTNLPFTLNSESSLFEHMQQTVTKQQASKGRDSGVAAESKRSSECKLPESPIPLDLKRDVEAVSVSREADGSSRGFAFVCCRTTEVAARLRQLLDGKMEVDGRVVSVSFSKKKKKTILKQSFNTASATGSSTSGVKGMSVSASEDSTIPPSSSSSTEPKRLSVSARRRMRRRKRAEMEEKDEKGDKNESEVAPVSQELSQSEADEPSAKRHEPEAKADERSASATAMIPTPSSPPVDVAGSLSTAVTSQQSSSSFADALEQLMRDLHEQEKVCQQIEAHYTALPNVMELRDGKLTVARSDDEMETEVDVPPVMPTKSVQSTHEHAAMKKIRSFLRAFGKSWRKIQEIESHFQMDTEMRQWMKQQLQTDATAYSIDSTNPTATQIRRMLHSCFRFLLVIMQHMLMQHIIKAVRCVAKSTNDSGKSGVGGGPAGKRKDDDDDSWLSHSLLHKDSPMRACKRLIETCYADVRREYDSEHEFQRAGVQHLPCFAAIIYSASTNGWHAWSDDYAAYDYLLFRANRMCEETCRAAGMGRHARLSLQQLTLDAPVLPPSLPSQLSFPPSVHHPMQNSLQQATSHALIQSALQCGAVQRFCLQQLNVSDSAEKEADKMETSNETSLTTPNSNSTALPPSSPALHSRLQFLIGLSRLIRSSIGQQYGSISIQVYGSLLTGTALGSNGSDMDVQIVFNANSRTTPSTDQQHARDLLASIKEPLRHAGLSVFAGQLNARTPVLHIRRSRQAATAALSSSRGNNAPSLLAPCDCDIGATHSADFIHADWYKQCIAASPTATLSASPSTPLLSPNVLKSLLLSHYLFMDDRVRSLYFLIRRWSHARCIHDAAQHTLSTFSWTIMLLHAMQHIQPPVLPILHVKQAIDAALKQATPSSPSSSCSSSSSYAAATLAAASKWHSSNAQSIPQLLYHFFHFYAPYETNAATRISIVKRFDDTADGSNSSAAATPIHPSSSFARAGVRTAVSFSPMQSTFMLEDPITPDENPARSLEHTQHWHRIRRECQRAAWIMQMYAEKKEADGPRATAAAVGQTASSTPSQTTTDVASSDLKLALINHTHAMMDVVARPLLPPTYLSTVAPTFVRHQSSSASWQSHLHLLIG